MKVHFSYYDCKGPFSSKSDHAHYTTIDCSSSESCGLLKTKRCAAVDKGCPYGKRVRVRGPTPRARSFYSFISDAKKAHEGLPWLGSPSGDSVALVGDYVYLPMAHMHNYVNSVEIEGMKGQFVPRSSLTPAVVKMLLEYRPQALFGGEIRSYQNEGVPIFARGLLECLPELVAEVKREYPSLAVYFAKTTNVGRKARLSTLKPDVGTFVDIHGASWRWDGEYLYSENSRGAFMLTRFSEVRIKPLPDEFVKVTDDAQVTRETIFEA